MLRYKKMSIALNIKSRCFNLIHFHILGVLMNKEVESVDLSKEDNSKKTDKPAPELTKEINGRAGPEPTRYGDWEKNGRCIDF